MSRYIIDLNCDMGESFGAFSIGNDEAILPFVSSVNIACGFHAGDPSVMKRTVRAAIKHGVSIGAHPGFPDLQGFGRREMVITDEEVYDLVLYQIGALSAFVKAEGGTLHHVKPHGALYNMAAVNSSLSNAIAKAVHAMEPQLILYGLAGSQLILSAKRIGLRVANEIFADRTYEPDGTLKPRHLAGAVIIDPKLAITQSIRMIAEGNADTICIHGDGKHAVEFAMSLYHNFQKEGIIIKSPK